MPSQHLEQIRVRATHPALYGLADKMRRVGKVMTGRHLLTRWAELEEATVRDMQIWTRKFTSKMMPTSSEW